MSSEARPRRADGRGTSRASNDVRCAMRVVTALFVVLLTGCGGERADVTPDKKSDPSAPSQPAAAASADYDLAFIDAMREHHEGAVEIARVALEKSTDAKIKELATKMVADQQKEIAQLSTWRDQWFSGASPADVAKVAGSASMNMDMTHMKNMSGHQFDMMFIDMMIPHHEGAVAMSCDAHEKAQRDEVRKFARDVVRAQEQEISQMETWKSEMKM